MKRRSFVIKSAATSGVISLLGISTFSCGSAEKKEMSQMNSGELPLGIQLFTLASVLSEDFTGTIRKLSEIGYKKLEFAGPYYYSSEEEIKNNFLIQRMGMKNYGYGGYTPADLKILLDDNGLSAPSAHVSLESLDFNIAEAMSSANILGHEFLTIPMMTESTLDGYKKAADKFNIIGEACHQAGIHFAYHNHSHEFGPLDGEIPLDLLLQRTDPNLVSFELDVFWTEVAGVRPIDYFTKYPGRFKMVHLKEMAKKMEEPNTELDTFIDLEKARAMISNQTIIGNGVIDFKEIIQDSQNAGVLHYFIESDFPPEPMIFAQESFTNISNLIKS